MSWMGIVGIGRFWLGGSVVLPLVKCVEANFNILIERVIISRTIAFAGKIVHYVQVLILSEGGTIQRCTLYFLTNRKDLTRP